MFQTRNLPVSDFIQITNAGVRIATFVEIRNALIERYKSVYGSDIDLSTGSADGIFVNDLTLIINNILQSMQTIVTNLNVNSASGAYLDILCALSNITRKSATYSNASIIVKNENSSATGDLGRVIFVDQAGTEWMSNENLSFEPNESKSVQVTCTEIGAIEAPAGWITQTLELSYLSVEQSVAANVGTNAESDASLRARRNQSTGATGTTVLDSLIGALRQINGIDDVKVYNNNTTSAETALDNTSILAHSIYVILRQNAGITIPDSTIGSLIYEKLTPGVRTNVSTDATTGIPKSYVYRPSLASGITLFNQNVYWKVAKPIAPEITINITAYDTFDESYFSNIATELFLYLNALQIGTTLQQNDVLLEAIYADPQYKGRATYTVTNVNITNAQNTDTYYNYANYSFSSGSPTPAGLRTYTLTLKGDTE